eukprot:tig00000403_g288.t1
MEDLHPKAKGMFSDLPPLVTPGKVVTESAGNEDQAIEEFKEQLPSYLQTYLQQELDKIGGPPPKKEKKKGKGKKGKK